MIAPDAATVAAVGECLTRERMALYGYTPEQINAAEKMTHPAAGCHYEHPYGWVCTDEDDKPRHPDRDELERTAEFVMWLLAADPIAQALAAVEAVARPEVVAAGEPPSLAGKVMPVHDAGVQVAAAYQQGLADARRLAAQPAAPQPTEGGELTEADREALHAPALCDCDDLLTCRTLAGLYADVGRIKADAYAAGRAARSQRPEGVTVTEWGVRDPSGMENGPWSEREARLDLEEIPPPRRGVLITRQRTTFPDVVTEWAAEVSGDTEAGGDR